MDMKKIGLSIVLALSFGFCFAPINLGPVPENMKKRELTDEERGKQQNNTPQIGEVGIVQQRENAPEMPDTTNDLSAQNTVANAMKHKDSPKPSDTAKKDVLTATETMEGAKPKSKASLLVWALVFGALGFGIVFGLRRWADKVVPDVPKKKKVTW